MNFELCITNFRPESFVLEACCHYVEQYFHFDLRFPQGYDAATDSGWVPAQINLGDSGGWLDTGFEAEFLQLHDSLNLSVPEGVDRFSLGLVHAVAAYCRMGKDSLVEDAQDGSLFDSRKEPVLHRRVFSYFLNPGGVDLRGPAIADEVDGISSAYQRLTEQANSLAELRTTDAQAAEELESSIHYDARLLFEDALELACDSSDPEYIFVGRPDTPMDWLERICQSMQQWFAPGSQELIAERLWWSERLTEAEEGRLAGETRALWIEARLRETTGREALARNDFHEAFWELRRAFVLECVMQRTGDENYRDVDGRVAQIVELLQKAGAQIGRSIDGDPRTDPQTQHALEACASAVLLDIDQRQADPLHRYWAKQLKCGQQAIAEKHFADAEAILSQLIDDMCSHEGELDSELGRRVRAAHGSIPGEQRSAADEQKRSKRAFGYFTIFLIGSLIVILYGVVKVVLGIID